MKIKENSVLIRTTVILAAILYLFLFDSCNKTSVINEHTVNIDLPDIRERGKLVVTTNYNSINYFVYRGQPMGFQFELLQHFSEFLGMKMEIIVNNDLDEIFNNLNSGNVDLIALNLAVTKERKELVSFTEPHSQTRQVLIQRKPDNWRKMNLHHIESKMIRNQTDLANKEVVIYVHHNSSFASRLKNLSDEIGDSIRFVEVTDDPETLISLVAKGEIDYTICDENVAIVNQSYYSNIDIKTPISFPQNIAWAVRKNSDELREEINRWLVSFKRTHKYAILHDKYFRSSRVNRMVTSEYFALKSGRISAYDDLIKEYAAEIGWDWRLLASLIYQESRFLPDARSWAGAFGLMQLMPATAAMYGVDSIADPALHIKAGADFIKWIDKTIADRIEDKDERIKFILASYNVGLGHVLDARRLADKNGKNPNIWENNVDYFVLNKSKPEYYLDPVVKHGYCRGSQTYNYVYDILERYEHYKNIVN